MTTKTGSGLKARIVTGDEDPFNQENRELFLKIMEAVKDLQIDQTIAIETVDYEEANKMRGVLHGVSKKLGWKAIRYDEAWRAYLVTVKEEKLFIHRLG